MIEAIGFDFDDTLMYTMDMKSQVFGEVMSKLFGIDAERSSQVYDEIANSTSRAERVPEIGRRFNHRFSEREVELFNELPIRGKPRGILWELE